MLHANGFYVSGTIVCFRDSLAARAFPSESLTEAATGMRFADSYDNYWLNIFEEDARSYITDLVAESVMLGFDEIILDDFFLPNVQDLSRLDYNDGGVSRNDAVSSFVTEVRTAIDGAAAQANESANTNRRVRLGLNIPARHLLNAGLLANPDNAVGLNIDELIPLADFFTSDFSPSNLPTGVAGFSSNPAAAPYETVRTLSARAGEVFPLGYVMFRPDLQAFDSPDGITYGDGQINSQRQALNEAGISVWTLINYDNTY